MAPALNREAEWPVQPGQLVGAKALGLALAQADPGNGFSVLHLVIEWHRVSP